MTPEPTKSTSFTWKICKEYMLLKYTDKIHLALKNKNEV